MTHVLTLIPAAPVIQPSLFNELLINLAEIGIEPTAIDWLEPRRVVDIYFKQPLPPEYAIKMSDMIAAYMTDMIVQDAETRDKKMLISDMDSTMITVECIDELADYVGKKEEVAKITERAMNGELDFAAALNDRVKLLAGLTEQTLQDCFNQRVRPMPGAPELLAVMKQQGAYCLLVSGGFDFFTSRVAAALGFDADISNRLEIVGGVLTGKVLQPIVDKDTKLKALQEHAAARGIEASEILAIGDGANDLPMLKGAGLGVAYRAKPHVRAEVSARVDYNDLTALIYAQGYQFKIS